MHFGGSADGLTELQGNQFADNEIAEGQAQHKGGYASADRAKCDIGKHIQGFEDIVVDPSACRPCGNLR